MTFNSGFFKLILFIISTFFIGCKIEEPQSPPSLKTLDASDVTTASATLNGTVVEEGYTATTDRGFVFSTNNQNPSVSDSKVSSGYGKGDYSGKIDKLAVNTKYYFKAYATNTKGTAYGSTLNFTTADYSLATLSTDLPINIGYTTVDLGGIVLTNGGATITARGICYSLNPNPTVNDGKVIIGSGLGSFKLNLTNLKDNTKYYTRAFATNAKGTAYGNEQTFTTVEFKLPTFLNKEINSLGSTSVIAGTDILDNGGTDIIEKGFCLNLSGSPTINDIKIKQGNGIGPYFSEIDQLKENTTYHLRPYAINSKGVGYGIQISFTTLNSNSIQTNLSKDLIGFYPLDGNSMDASGNGLDLITKGTVATNVTVNNRFSQTGKCYGFNSYGGVVTSNNKIPDNKNGLSFSLWIKNNVFNLAGGLASRKFIGLNLINSSSEEYNFYISDKFYMINSEFSKNKFPKSSIIQFDNTKWHHIVINFDYNNKLLGYYVDGVRNNLSLENIKNLGFSNLSIGSSFERLDVINGGADVLYDRWGWSGYIDDVGIWNRTLSKDEINYLYQNNYRP